MSNNLSEMKDYLRNPWKRGGTHGRSRIFHGGQNVTFSLKNKHELLQVRTSSSRCYQLSFKRHIYFSQCYGCFQIIMKVHTISKNGMDFTAQPGICSLLDWDGSFKLIARLSDCCFTDKNRRDNSEVGDVKWGSRAVSWGAIYFPRWCLSYAFA